MLDMAGFPKASGLGTLIAEKVFNAAADSCKFSGLDGNTDGWYDLEIESTSGPGAILYLHVNEITVVGNYSLKCLFLSAGSNTPGGTTGNSSEIVQMAANKPAIVRVSCARMTNGCFGYRSDSIRDLTDTASAGMVWYAGWSAFTIPNINSLTITSSVAGGIGDGTKIRLFKGKR